MEYEAAVAAVAEDTAKCRTLTTRSGELPYAWDLAKVHRARKGAGPLVVPQYSACAFKMHYGFPMGAIEAIRLELASYQRTAFDRAGNIELFNSPVSGETVVALKDIGGSAHFAGSARRTKWMNWYDKAADGADLGELPTTNKFFLQAKTGVAQFPGIVARSDVRVIGAKERTQVGEILVELDRDSPPMINGVVFTPAYRVFDEAQCFGFTVKFNYPQAWDAALFLHHEKGLHVKISNEWALRVWGTNISTLRDYYPDATVIDEKPFDGSKENTKDRVRRARDPIVRHHDKRVVRVQCLDGVWRNGAHIDAIAKHHGIELLKDSVRIDHFAGTVPSEEARQRVLGVFNGGYYAIHSEMSYLLNDPPQ